MYTDQESSRSTVDSPSSASGARAPAGLPLSPRLFAGLPVVRLEFVLRAAAATALPNFLGSTLRGAFGHALKEAICVMEHRQCERCEVRAHCLYAYLFETPVPEHLPHLQRQQNVPHPFVCEPPETDSPAGQRTVTPNDDLIFGFTLFGRAVAALPYVIYAMERAALRGLGFDRMRFALKEVRLKTLADETVTIYAAPVRQLKLPDKIEFGLDEYVQARLPQFPPAERVRLRFLTPARIRVQDQAQTELSFAALVHYLLRRSAMLVEIHGDGIFAEDWRAWLPHADRVTCQSTPPPWWELDRYSNRQQRKVKLSGFVGELEYSGAAVTDFWPLLVAGELLHVGSGTAFGLGRYEILR